MKLYHKNKEVEITLEYSEKVGAKPELTLTGKGDLPHHLIEEAFNVLEKLARMERVPHQRREL